MSGGDRALRALQPRPRPRPRLVCPVSLQSSPWPGRVWPTPLLTLQLVRPKLLMFAFPFCNQTKLVGDFTQLGPWPLFCL